MLDSRIPSGTIDQFGSQFARYSLDPVFITTPQGDILYANPAACELFGYTNEEFIAGGRGLIVDNNDPELLSLIEKRKRHGYVRGEHWMYSKDGRPIRMEISSSIFHTNDNELRSVVIARDVSIQHRKEYEHSLLEAAAAAAPLVVCITDEEWRILWANPATEQTSGHALADLVGHPAPMRRYLEESMPDVLAAMEADLKKTGKWTGQVFTRRRNGEVYPLFGSISVVEVTGSGQRRYVAALSDVSRLREFERKIHDLSLYDPITGLPNRALFNQKAKVVLNHPESDETSPHLLLIDLDGFTTFNESLGYENGDVVLKRVAERLNAALDGKYIFSRHIGDSFALLITDPGHITVLESLIERIRSALSAPFKANGHSISLSASIGVSAYPGDGTDPQELLKKAGIALRRVKQEGGNGYAFYQKGAEASSHRFVKLAAPMREGLDKGEFEAYFQPIVETHTRRIVGMESLARWRRADGTFVSPYEFIAVAEQGGMIRSISELMLRQTCRHLKSMEELGYEGLKASLNLSAREFRDRALARRILSIIREADLSPDAINIEITESQLMNHPEESMETLSTLQKNGMRIVIDDFGTGYSSLAYLTQFSVNGIKLDRFFIQDIPGNKKSEDLFSMMIALGEKLDIPVVAEGVETESQVEFLRNHGCPRFQGYLVSPALPADEFIALLRA